MHNSLDGDLQGYEYGGMIMALASTLIPSCPEIHPHAEPRNTHRNTRGTFLL